MIFHSLVLSQCSTHGYTHNRGQHEQQVPKSQAHQVDTAVIDDSLDDKYVWAINKWHHESPGAMIQICNTLVNVLVDTGASVNILDQQSYQAINHTTDLKLTNMQIYLYGTNKELPIKGQMTAMVESRH